MSRRAALLVFLAAALFRAALLGAFDLMPQSAYYSTYAEHPSLSYYDHPPMIGWLLALWYGVFGRSALVLRIAVFATTLATQLGVYALGREILGKERGSSALAIFASTSTATLLSFIAVPDVPLLLFWTLALWSLHRMLLSEPPPSQPASPRPGDRFGSWPVAGVLMGLALLSKYTAVYLQGGLVLFLLCSPEHRRRLRTAEPWLAVALAHVVALPVYVWNARHGWASFAYQSVGRASEVSGIDWDDVLGFLASQALVFLPVPLFAFLWIAGRDVARVLRSPLRMDRLEGTGATDRAERLFLLAFSVPVFATCIGLSTVTWVKSNWPMPAYVAATLLISAHLGRRAVRWHLVTSALLHAVLAVWLLWYPVPVESDDTWFGWTELAERVESRFEALEDEHPGLFVFSADHYKTTAELRFYTDLPVYGMNVIGWNALHYEYIGEDPDALAGRDALFVRSEAKLRPTDETGRYLERIRGFFESVRELEPIEVRRRGETVRLFRVFLCEGYGGVGS